MRIYLVLLVLLPFLACKKDSNPPQPPAPVDTLGTGWKKVALPSTPGGADVFFINNSFGYAVGSNFIDRSIDGGNTWQKVYQSPVSFVNIAMNGTANAIFCTNNSNPSKLFFTSNGGNSFDSVMVGDGITDVFLVSPTTGYAIGQKFWKTTNGGASWTSIFDFSSLPGGGYRSLHFLNDQVGWWIGTGGVYFTANGGTSWTSQPLPNFGISTGSIYFVDANNGYLAYDMGAGKTTNGGAGWTKINSFQGGYHDVHFLSSTTGYVSDYNYLYKTTDGGVTWTKEVTLAHGGIIEIHFTDANHGWAIYDGFVLKYER